MNNTQAKSLIVLAALYISALIFFFLPSEIYLGNPREFISTRPLLMMNLLFGGLIFASALFLPALIPANSWRRVYATFLSGAFIALWVSGVFLVTDFGEFDGSSFDLSQHTETLAAQSAWFTFVFVAACVCVWKWSALVIRLIGIIGIGLFLIGASNFYRAGSMDDAIWEPVNLKDITRFSTDRNLLIVLMDTFQSDVLQQIVDQDPLIGEQLNGFRFYPDTLGVAPSTYLTMPAFHSGMTYNNMMALTEYYDLGVREGSFLVELAENGYQVDVINPIAGVCPLKASTCKRQETLLLHAEEVTSSETSRLADLGILRGTPGLLKQWVFSDNSGPITRLRNGNTLSGLNLRIYQGNTVLELIANNLWTDNTAPTAKLIHLLNTHAPYMFDRDCQFTGTKNAQDRAHMTLQSICAMHWFLHLLDQMKAEGIYENSMIILTADTGAGTIYGSEDLSSLYAQAHGIEAGELGRLIGGANPVLAIKFPGAHGRMQTSAIQAQLTDLPRTVCENLQDCTKTEGINLGVNESTVRERIYYHYRWENEYWGLNHIPGIIQYTVNGPLWLESSWSRNFIDEIPTEISKVDFSNEDEAGIFGMGWGQVEVNQAGISKRWSIAKKAELFLPLPTGEDLTLQFQVLMAPGIIDQVITVKVNGEIVGSRGLEERVQFVTVSVPARLISKPVSEISLEFSKIRQPETPGRRNISVSFYQLKIYRSPD